MSEEQIFTITELAREFNITSRTIRFYEDQGLLSPRRAGRARIYGKRDRTRLKLTLRGKRLGLSLAQIKELLELYDTARDESAQLYKFLVALSKRRIALEQQREDIEAVLSEIYALEKQCRTLLDKAGPEAKQPAKRGAHHLL